MESRLARLAVGVALVLGSLTLSAAPANAAGTRLIGMDGVLYGGCEYQSFGYEIDPEKAQNNWTLTVTAYDPRGAAVVSKSLAKISSHPPSGTGKGPISGLQICASELPGTWRLKARLSYFQGPPAEELPSVTFQMRKARSKTSLAVNDTTASYGQKLTFTIRSKAEYPGGLKAHYYVPVKLQRKVGTSWKVIATSGTNQYGVAKVTMKWNYRNAVVVRAVTPASSPYTGSTSPSLTIR